MNLVLSKQTQAQVDSLTTNPPHALLLIGEAGMGTTTLARQMAGGRLADIIEPTLATGEIDHQKGVVRVSQIRKLYEITAGKSLTDRVYILDSADKMNPQAQGALLKLLEEPVDNIRFILTAHTIEPILPTILSRAQRITMSPISEVQSEELLQQLGVKDPQQIAKLHFIAAGKPALIVRYAGNPSELEKMSTLMVDARSLLQGSVYDRLVICQKYASDRAQGLRLIEAAESILKHTIASKPSEEIIDNMTRLAEAYDAIARNGNVRIQLMASVV